MEPKETVGANIRAQRERRKWTQERLADEAGMHLREVGRAERGNRDMRISTVAKFARALDVPASKLVDGI
ncbi:MAG TPA: helix-turn-helix transcriptional regulator [Solirubrobacterales bacterium]|nr:helix-turn-helix transcriptional regulator [Solirubrobacterales bacterium]